MSQFDGLNSFSLVIGGLFFVQIDLASQSCVVIHEVQQQRALGGTDQHLDP